MPADISSPRAARGAAGRWLGRSGETADLLLCVSELVTNAVLHARRAVRLEVMTTGSLVRVEVHDDDPMMPTPRNPGPEEPTGRGLLLVDRLATDWGVETRSTGKVVWFTMHLGAVQE